MSSAQTIEAVRSKRTIGDLMSDRPGLRLIGITRRGDAFRIYQPLEELLSPETELTWFEDWNAWSVRLGKGPYQQLCIFEPVLEVQSNV